MNEEQILDLLVRWDDLRSQEKEISPEELCSECPELLEEVRRRIASLKATAWMEKSGDEPSPKPAPTVGMPHKTLGEFRLDSLIGDGGFGEVWKAFDLALKRNVAIKIPKKNNLASFDQFIEEACKVARLPRHTGIVQVYEVERDGDTCFIVSDFIDGCTLAKRIDNNPPDVPTALEWVAQIADALHYAHGEKIVHRDIKPSNILLSKDDKPLITDFGISVDEDEPLDHRAATRGTLEFMSPEQVGGGPVDRRTDIYSLGVVFYLMLTGRLPYQAKSDYVVQKAILEGRPKRPSQINDKIPKRAERICLKAMARDPADRYLTAKAFADDVRAYLNPRGPWRKVAVIGSTVVLVLALLVGRWVWNAQEDARDTGRKVEQQTIQVQDRVNTVLADVEKNYGVPRPKASSIEPTPESKPETPAREKGLPRLSFSDMTVDLTSHELADADFEQLGRHIVLRRLVLTNTPTTDTQLDQLRSVPGLERLDLAGTHVSDAGVERLTNFAALQDLSLARTSITDASLKPIGSVRLRVLDLSNTKITDVGVKHLARRYGTGDSLTDLNLAGTSITDSCVSSLASMPRLVRLVVTETKLSEEAVKQLQVALPKCQVER